jgi:hypothetical protein
MNIDEQRVLGVSLVAGDQWTKTREIISNNQHCYGVILLKAIKENGLDAVVDKLLQGPPEWAYRALSDIPNLDNQHRDALIRKAAEEPEWAARTLYDIPELGANSELVRKAAGPLADSQGNISKIYLFNAGSYTCKFCIHWIDGGNEQDGIVWSRDMNLGESSGDIRLLDLVTQSQPFNPGDAVWLYLWVYGGNDTQSSRFTYDPNGQEVNFRSSGAASTPKLDFSFTN